MYHTHKATDRRDKVYALLGMSSDDPTIAGLSANYEISWGQLFPRLVNFFFSEQVSVDTWDDKEMTVFRGMGRVLGQVSSLSARIDREDRQEVCITQKHDFGFEEQGSLWHFQASAKSVQQGDVICLLQGASVPTIIRPCSDYWAVVMIAVPPLNGLQTPSTAHHAEPLEFTETKKSSHDFLLVWDWDTYPDKLLDREDYEHLMGTLMSKCPKAELEDRLNKVIRLRDIGVVLDYMQRYDRARESFRKAMEIFESALRSMDCPELACPCHGRWGKGDIEKLEGMVGLLIKDEGRWMPLCLAGEIGRETMVKLLLGTGEVGPDAKEGVHGRTPLSFAAENGHEAVVELLLSTGKVDPDSKGAVYGQTPLSFAAENGHEAVVKLLLDTDKVNPDTEAIYYKGTPLLLAVENGHEPVVKLLLNTGKVSLNARGNIGRTPLSLAEVMGREAIARLLLDAEGGHKQTPLSRAARRMYKAMVKPRQST